jgi:hypothetical protein
MNMFPDRNGRGKVEAMLMACPAPPLPLLLLSMQFFL